MASNEGIDEAHDAAITAFDTAVTEATRVSFATGGRPAPSQPAWWATVLFTRLCTNSVSLLHLVPRSRFAGRLIEHYDFSAVASLTRNLWECYFAFFYLAEDVTEGDEWLTRLNVLQLHDCLSRWKMFSEFDANHAQLPGFIAEADDLRERIKGREFFRGLPVKRQNHILKGEQALLLSQDEMLGRMAENVATFRGMYRYLSFHVHSLPVSYYRMDEREQARGLESDWEKSNISIALEFALTPVARAMQAMKTLFPDVTSNQETSD